MMRLGRGQEIRAVSDVLRKSDKEFTARKATEDKRDKRIIWAQEKMYNSSTALLDLLKKSDIDEVFLDEADPHAELSEALLKTFEGIQIWVKREITAHQANPVPDPESLGADNFKRLGQMQSVKLNAISDQCSRNLGVMYKQNKIRLLNIKLAAVNKEQIEQDRIAAQLKKDNDKKEEDRQIEVEHQIKLKRESEEKMTREREERLRAVALAAESSKREELLVEAEKDVVDPLLAEKWEMVEKILTGSGSKKKSKKKSKKTNRKRK
jgi:hypothetical protein